MVLDMWIAVQCYGLHLQTLGQIAPPRAFSAQLTSPVGAHLEGFGL